jgi:hypothetical protein
MKTVKLTRHVRRSIGLACIGALLLASQTWAGIEPVPFRTGLFGVTAGQAVRISVLNGAGERSMVNPLVRVRDATGRLLAEVDAGRVTGGTGGFVDVVPMAGDGAGTTTPTLSRSGARLQVRVEIQIRSWALPGSDEDDLAALRRLLARVIPTLEVFDTATGRTIYTVPYAEVAGIEPTPF